MSEEIKETFDLTFDCIETMLADNGMLARGASLRRNPVLSGDLPEKMRAAERFLAAHTGSARDYLDCDGEEFEHLSEDELDESVLTTMACGEHSVVEALLNVGGDDARALNEILGRVFEGDLMDVFVDYGKDSIELAVEVLCQPVPRHVMERVQLDLSRMFVAYGLNNGQAITSLLTHVVVIMARASTVSPAATHMILRAYGEWMSNVYGGEQGREDGEEVQKSDAGK